MRTKEEIRKYRREWMRKFNKTPEGKAYNKSCREAWRNKNPNQEENYKERARDLRFQREFGITLDIYNEMFLKQRGCCAICTRHQSEFKRRLAIDHCHVSGQVRKLLCHNCNALLGHARDDANILEVAIKYLTGY